MSRPIPNVWNGSRECFPHDRHTWYPGSVNNQHLNASTFYLSEKLGSVSSDVSSTRRNLLGRKYSDQT